MAHRARRLRKSVHTSELEVFCALLKGARQSKGVTQQVLAKRLGKHQSFVAKYERGERRIDVVEYLTIMRAIGADPVKLLRTIIKAID